MFGLNTRGVPAGRALSATLVGLAALTPISLLAPDLLRPPVTLIEAYDGTVVLEIANDPTLLLLLLETFSG